MKFLLDSDTSPVFINSIGEVFFKVKQREEHEKKHSKGWIAFIPALFLCL